MRGATLGVALLLAVVPLDESGGLVAADRGWWLSIGLALTASVAAAFIRRPAPAR